MTYCYFLLSIRSELKVHFRRKCNDSFSLYKFFFILINI
jgi:hypothetical protein